MRRWLSPALRLASTLILLGVLAWKLDTGDLVSRLANLAPGWALLAALIGIPQVLLSAWRWRMTARRLGVPLPWSDAISEYYLATFVNQILPGGVMGDAARAWRHGNQSNAVTGACSRGPAIRAVVIERASGQFALVFVALVAIIASPTLRSGIASASVYVDTGWLLTAVIPTLAILIIAGILWYRRPVATSSVFLVDLKRALLASRAWPPQLFSSLLVVGTYIAVFLCAARALGNPRPLSEWLPLIPPLLMAMAVPLTIAGWGVREGAASLIWPLAGLPAQEGVMLSVTYGLLVLAGSLPGLAVLMLDRLAARHHPRPRVSMSGIRLPGEQTG